MSKGPKKVCVWGESKGQYLFINYLSLDATLRGRPQQNQYQVSWGNSEVTLDQELKRIKSMEN